MAKQRRAQLTAVTAPAGPPPAATARRRTPDPRESVSTAALYARVPLETKRRLDVSAALLGQTVAAIVTAVLDEHVDPNDQAQLDALQALLERPS